MKKLLLKSVLLCVNLWPAFVFAGTHAAVTVNTNTGQLSNLGFSTGGLVNIIWSNIATGAWGRITTNSHFEFYDESGTTNKTGTNGYAGIWGPTGSYDYTSNGSRVISGSVTAVSGTITGNGAGLTGVPFTGMTGNLAQAQLPSDVVTNMQAGNWTSVGIATFSGGINTLSENYTGGAISVANGGSIYEYLDSESNTYFGTHAFNINLSGSDETLLGAYAGSAYTGGESSNIDIGSPGVVGESQQIHIGSKQTNTTIAGVLNGNGGGLTNIQGANIVPSYQFTNLLAFSSGSVHNTSFAAYYTNNTGSNADVYFTAVATPSGENAWAYYIFDTVAANAPFSGMTNTVPSSYSEGGYLQTIQFLVRPGEYFAISNTVGTGYAGSTNRVVLHLP